MKIQILLLILTALISVPAKADLCTASNMIVEGIADCKDNTATGDANTSVYCVCGEWKTAVENSFGICSSGVPKTTINHYWKPAMYKKFIDYEGRRYEASCCKPMKAKKVKYENSEVLCWGGGGKKQCYVTTVTTTTYKWSTGEYTEPQQTGETQNSFVSPNILPCPQMQQFQKAGQQQQQTQQQTQQQQ